MNITLTVREKRLLITMGVLFVVSVLGPQFTLQWAQEDLARQDSLERNYRNQITDLSARLEGIEDEREAVRSNRENYLGWVSRGVVGEQSPINWVKAMKDVQVERKFYPVDYQFGLQNLTNPDISPFTQESTVNIRLWEMTMGMEMLYDLDMLVFLEDLQKRVESFFFPVECDFTMTGGEFSLAYKPNMKSNCRLVWISVEDADSNVVGASAGAATTTAAVSQ